MSLKLFAHPFSSYCQKALTALYEAGLPFEYLMLDPDHPENGARFAALWPVRDRRGTQALAPPFSPLTFQGE